MNISKETTKIVKSSNILKATTRIPSWMKMEIDAVYRVYFDSHPPKLYWPKPLRAFLKNLIETAISTLGKEFFSSVDDLEQVLLKLNEPTSMYITARNRNSIREAIETIRLRMPNCGFNIKSPSYLSSVQITKCEWPDDVLEVDDLYSSLSTKSIRIDIENFIWNLIWNLFDNQAIFKIYFNGRILDETLKPYKYPINVEIQGEDKCEQLKNYIYTISKQYRLKHEGIPPCDVIEVNFREEIPEVYVKEEEFHTSGSMPIGINPV